MLNKVPKPKSKSKAIVECSYSHFSFYQESFQLCWHKMTQSSIFFYPFLPQVLSGDQRSHSSLLLSAFKKKSKKWFVFVQFCSQKSITFENFERSIVRLLFLGYRKNATSSSKMKTKHRDGVQFYQSHGKSRVAEERISDGISRPKTFDAAAKGNRRSLRNKKLWSSGTGYSKLGPGGDRPVVPWDWKG